MSRTWSSTRCTGSERLLFFDDAERTARWTSSSGASACRTRSRSRDASASSPLTVPLAELLLTKLQIAELNEKDVRDSLALLHGHPGRRRGRRHRQRRPASPTLLSDDWGLWRTFTGNLAACRDHLAAYGLGEEDAQPIAGADRSCSANGSRRSRSPALEASRADRRAQALVRDARGGRRRTPSPPVNWWPRSFPLRSSTSAPRRMPSLYSLPGLRQTVRPSLWTPRDSCRCPWRPSSGW